MVRPCPFTFQLPALPSNLPSALKQSFILIDFESVQPKDLAQLRGRPFKTKVFCGATQTKVSLDLAAELQPLGSDAEYIRIQGTGHNALDFHIAYYIGRLSTELPNADFYVISKDTGFDPLIKHLKTQNIICRRVASLNEIAGLNAQPATPAQERIQKIADTLIECASSRPRTLKTLTAFIKAQLNHHGTDAAIQDAINRLERGGMTRLPDGKVAYPPPPDL
jgi:hypothetical protein